MTMLKRKRAGLGDAMAVVTRFVNACNRHDADAVYACLHPDFDSIQPMFPSRNFRGADQVRRNWQAIFDAEPGFRLTVLRSAATDDTVWLELHGAGRDAEVAGVFVMGIQGDRIRWARIYSALVEPLPASAAGAADASGQLRQVPGHDDGSAVAGNGEVVEEALIAPVVDIERSSRRRRRSSRRGAEPAVAAPVAEPPVAEPPAAEGPAAEAVVTEPAVAEAAGGPAADVVADDVAATVQATGAPVESEVEVVDLTAAAPAAGPQPQTHVLDPLDTGPQPQVEVEVVDEVIPRQQPAEPEPEPVPSPSPVPTPELVAEPTAVAGDTVEAEPAAQAATEPEPEPERTVVDPPPGDKPRRLFGKKGR